jgi:hypothetical protein
MIAAKYGQAEAAAMLIASGIDVNHSDAVVQFRFCYYCKAALTRR